MGSLACLELKQFGYGLERRKINRFVVKFVGSSVVERVPPMVVEWAFCLENLEFVVTSSFEKHSIT